MAAKSSSTKAAISASSSKKTSAPQPAGGRGQDGVKLKHAISEDANWQEQFTDLSRRLHAVETHVAAPAAPRMSREWSADTLYDTGRQHITPKKETRSYQASVSDSTESDSDPEQEQETRTRPPERQHARTTASASRTQHAAAKAASSPIPIPPYGAKNNNTSLPASPPPASPLTQPPTVRFSDRNPITLHNRTSKAYKPQKDTPAMTPTPTPNPGADNKKVPHVSPSPVDAKWGILFNEGGEPSQRMANILRGLAKYIIANYKPPNPHVVMPEQLHKFYTVFQLAKEALDLTRFFACPSREAMRNLENLYLDLQCEYHLVQDPRATGAKPRATIPGLTPEGFVKWTLLLIRSFPDKEAARLGAVVEACALEAVTLDGGGGGGGAAARERLPRQISRHLFPDTLHEEAMTLVTQSVQYWNRAMAAAEGPEKKTDDVVAAAYVLPLRGGEKRDDGNRGRDNGRGAIVEVSSSSRRYIVSPPRDRDRNRDRDRERDRERDRDRPSRPTLAGPDDRLGRHHSKSYRREASPRRQKRNERDGKDDGSKGRRRRWTIDGSETGKSPIRRRDSRSGR